MLEASNENYHFSYSMIELELIDPSPYQHRRYFDDNALKELCASILHDGLIEPIIVRSKKAGRYQLIAGERRVKAIKDYTKIKDIQAKIAEVDDDQARRICATENFLRKDLSTIESIEATVEIIDAEMEKDALYLTVGKTPLERVHNLLSKLDSIRRSRERGSLVSKDDSHLSNTYIGQVELIFKNLPKSLK
jgi:ParB/RepB/Spo0J family partition protein